MKKFFKMFLLFLIVSAVSFSQIKIGIDDTAPEIKQHIILNVEFLGEEKAEYTVRGIEKFKIISMVSRSNYTSVNKKVNYSKSDVYILCPQEEGKAVISVTAKDGSVSNEITVNILKESVNKNSEQKFILETTPYKRDFYMGEKIPFVEKVIIKSSVSNYNYVSTPVFNGFSVKNVTPRDSRGFPIPKRVTAEGKEQIELVLFRSILDPVSAGKKFIKSGGISITEDISEAEENTAVYLGFKEIGINILPLPQKDKPENFQGVVGILKGNYTWENTIYNGRQALILKLKLYGNVNLDKLENIIPPDSNIRKKYDVKETLLSHDERVLDSIYSSEKEYEIIFFPKNSNITKIPLVQIVYFNPLEKKYEIFEIKDDIFSHTGEKEQNFSYEHEKEVSFVPKNQIKTDNFLNLSKEKNITAETGIYIEKSKNKDIKNIIIIILSFTVAVETLYILKLKKRRQNDINKQ